MGVAMVTAKSGLLMHRQPDVESPRIELIPYGEYVRIVKREGAWCEVGWTSPQLGWLTGWVWHKYLSELVEPRAPKPEPVVPIRPPVVPPPPIFPPPPKLRVFDAFMSIAALLLVLAVLWALYRALI